MLVESTLRVFERDFDRTFVVVCAEVSVELRAERVENDAVDAVSTSRERLRDFVRAVDASGEDTTEDAREDPVDVVPVSRERVFDLVPPESGEVALGPEVEI